MRILISSELVVGHIGREISRNNLSVEDIVVGTRVARKSGNLRIVVIRGACPVVSGLSPRQTQLSV